MATRRKRDPEIASDVTRAFVVVVEEMRSQFKVFGEKLTSLDAKVTSLDAKVTSLDEKFTGKIDALDGKVASLDAKLTGKLDALDAKFTAKFDSLDLRLERVELDVGLVKVAVLETRQELKKKVDRDEVEAIVRRHI